MPKESHERRHYQSFRPFSPFSDAEALEDGEAARRLGLSADSAAVPLQNVPWEYGRSSIPVDFSLHREKGKEKKCGLTAEERKSQFRGAEGQVPLTHNKWIIIRKLIKLKVGSIN